MGEAALRRSATQKFIEQYPDCCFCAGVRRACTREHMPPKSLFDGSHRPDKLVMPSCDECNRGTSTADLAAAIISRWSYRPGSASDEDHARLVGRARRQAPELVEEWTEHLGPFQSFRGREHLRRQGVRVPNDAGIVTIGLQTIRLLNLFAHKAVLALYFEHFRRPLATNGAFCAFWRTKEDYARDGIPEKLLRMLPKHGTLTQGRWDVRETFEYRHAINVEEGLFGFLARLRQGLFISGFVVSDFNEVPPDDDDWIAPGDLLGLMTTPRFRKKL